MEGGLIGSDKPPRPAARAIRRLALPALLTAFAAPAAAAQDLRLPPLEERWGPQRAELRHSYACPQGRVDLEIESGPDAVTVRRLAYDGQPVPPPVLEALNQRLSPLGKLATAQLRCGPKSEAIYVQGYTKAPGGAPRAISLVLRAKQLAEP